MRVGSMRVDSTRVECMPIECMPIESMRDARALPPEAHAVTGIPGAAPAGTGTTC